MKKPTIQFQLFISYSTLIIVFIIITAGFFYFYFTTTLRERAEESLYQLVVSVSREIDNEIQEMDNISKKLAYSNLLKERFLSYLTNPSEVNLYLNQTALRDIFIAIMGPMEKWYQINLYDFNGHMVGAGNRNSISNLDVKSRFWYEETVKRSGARMITPPYKDDQWQSEPLIISLNRVYYDNYYQAIGIIEVQYELHNIFKAVVDSIYTTEDISNRRQIYVFTESGKTIFPLGDQSVDKTESYYHLGLDSGDTALRVEQTAGKGNLILVSRKSEYTGWYTVIIEDEAELFQPVKVFTRLLFIFCLITVASSLVISFFISNRVSKPIKLLDSTVASLTLETFPENFSNTKSEHFNEIESLQNTFREMHTRIQGAAVELVSSRSRELESRMLALQAKMNPHFLYNTIATINVLADEQGNTEIKKIGSDLSKMLRYIATNASAMVTLREDIDQTRRYLNLMKHRYEEKISYKINIPDKLMTIQVPRLIIQPFTENSLKYGIDVPPPWMISITGKIESGCWLIEITDNGSGFSHEKLSSIQEIMSVMDPYKPIKADTLEGIGILNIYARLKLLYKEDAIFKIGNLPEGGARIIIGGPLPQAGK